MSLQKRYARQIILSQIGKEGQAKLARARVLCIGAGGLGSPALLYLAAAGVGQIGICDFDNVDESNLQRQILHDTNAVGHAKTDSAYKRLHDLNPQFISRDFPRLFSQIMFSGFSRNMILFWTGQIISQQST